MGVKIETGDSSVRVYLDGEIDHHCAPSIRNEIDLAIDGCHPENLVMDFGEVTFMDSSGIGLVMGRYQAMKNIGGRVSLENTPVHIKKVMRLAGLDRFASIS
ncbi:MAG: STAS domain-containing protein [Ruminococcus sp.]|nr:STAS domain-containing protein [Ruminococcus sp.]